MEVRVRERLIGALVLVAIVVAVVPAILKGRAPVVAEPPNAQIRRVEVPIGNESATVDDPELVPEPALPAATPQASPRQPQAAPGRSADKFTQPPTREAAPSRSAPSPAAKENATSTQPPPQPKAAAPTAQPAEKPVSTTQTAWAVQLGAYSSRDKADRFVADLRKRGFAAFVLEYRASGKVLYRVRVGPELDRGRADAIAARLAKEGYQPVVARHP